MRLIAEICRGRDAYGFKTGDTVLATLNCCGKHLLLNVACRDL
jgi:hypothetical protein